MIINIDAKSLEWVTYLYLSQDPVGIEEWYAVVEDSKKNDMHTANQLRFSLPSRLIAKVFLFRWIYRGPAFAYAYDPDFKPVSSSVEFWQDIIDQYYNKYKGIYYTHKQYINTVKETGILTSPFGREYEFKKYYKQGSMEYSEYEITNYPNQGLGADVMAVYRATVKSRFSKYKLNSLLISTIHDSVSADVIESEKEIVKEIFLDSFKVLPRNIEKCLGVKWNLPMCGEISEGPNLKDLTEIK